MTALTSGTGGGGSDPDGTGVVPLVGRAQEWQRLSEQLAAVKAGRLRMVFIEGEAGIGKTRLVEELRVEATRAGFRVLAGRADQLEQMRPFGALVDALADLEPDGQAGEGAHALSTLVNAGDEPRLADALLDLVEALAVARPVLLVAEDLHWADPATVGALRMLGRRLPYLPILIVATYRPHPAPPELRRLVDAASREDAVCLTLGELSDAGVIDLAREMLGAGIGSGLAEVLRAAAGNALFVSELIRGLRDEGKIAISGGTADTEPSSLSPSLRMTILRRLSFLPSETLEVLRPAAVLGSSFLVEELTAIAPDRLRDVVAALQPAVASRVLMEWGAGLRFRHDLIQEAVYEDIPAALRAPVHVEAAKWLRASGASSARVAGHLLRGVHVGDRALIDLMVQMGKELRYSAPRVSIELCQRAIDLVGDEDPLADELRIQTLLPLTLVGRRHEAVSLAEALLSRPHEPSSEAAVRLSIIEAKNRGSASSSTRSHAKTLPCVSHEGARRPTHALCTRRRWQPSRTSRPRGTWHA